MTQIIIFQCETVHEHRQEIMFVDMDRAMAEEFADSTTEHRNSINIHRENIRSLNQKLRSAPFVARG